jgi:biotin synthase
MTLQELQRLHDLPLFDLLKQAREVHEAHWPAAEIQLCTLLSIKTGGCSEDCSYCAQSARYNSGVEIERLMSKDAVMERARAARETGSTRFCMGAAWRGVRGGTQRFEQVLDIVRDVSSLGMEVCVTLGELGPEEARQLRDAGVTAYNHNLDTSPEHYPNIVTTHTYDDRLRTIRNVQDAGMSVCCGGIVGMGESREQRAAFIARLANLSPYPESVPINHLVPVAGTPLADQPPMDPLEFVRTIAVARITMPKARVRLSAGRQELGRAVQAMCFQAGANSIFYGDQLLTTGNPEAEEDRALLAELGLKTKQHMKAEVTV